MFAFKSYEVEVCASHLSRSVHLPYRVIGDCKFFDLKKKDRKVERILVRVGCDGTSRPLSKTTIIETIRDARDAEFWKRLARHQHSDLQNAKKPRISRDEAAAILLLEDVSFTVTLPEYGHIPSFDVKVLLTKPWGGPLLVELSETMLEYLSNVVMFQIECEQHSNAHPRSALPEPDRFDSDGIPGLSKCYKENKLRLQVKRPGVKGIVRNFYINIAGDSDEDAKRKARNILESITDCNVEGANDTEVAEEAVDSNED